MPNKEHLAILKKGAEDWNRWREENPDEQPDLNRTNLRAADLSGANLEGAYLSDTYLSEADLSGAGLNRADLSDANLSRANLIEAKLIDADLSRANLVAAHLRGANLRDANLSGAGLNLADLSGAILLGADLSGANLSDAILRGADLREADLSDADLRGADLNNANLSDANLRAARVEVDTLFEVRLSLRTIRSLPYASAQALLGFDDQAHIIRSIEFPPEYKAAGLAILTHFEDVVRSKYSDLDVRVTITQKDNRVTMIIETEDGGELEKIEKTLEEYGLVVRGEMAPEKMLTDPLAILKLENQLSLAQHQLQMQQKMLAVMGDMHRELMAYRDVEVTELRRLVSEAITRPPAKPPDVYVSPAINVTVAQSQTSTQHQHVEISQRLEALRGSLADLVQQLPQDDPAATELADAARELEDAVRDPESAKTSSPVPERVRRFFEALGDEESRLGKTVKGVKRVAEVAQTLAKRYNDVAQWMGWPQVPKPFLGKGSKKERTKE